MDKTDALKTIDDINKFCFKGPSKNIDMDGFHRRIEALSEISQELPELTDNILKTCKTLFQSDHGDDWGAMYAFRALNQILKDNPELCDECYDIIKIAIKFNKIQYRDNEKYASVHELLKNILEKKPEIANDVVDFYAANMKIERIDWKDAYYREVDLNDFLNKKPQTAAKVVDLLDEYLQSGILDKQYEYGSYSAGDYNPIQVIYEILGNAATFKPELIDKVSEVYKLALSLNENNYSSYGESVYKTVYASLKHIIEHHAELSDKVFDIFETAIQSDKNDSNTLIRAYNNLGKIFDIKPELSDKILNLLKIGIVSPKNDYNSLKSIYTNLEKIIQIKSELINECLDVFKMALESEKNTGKSNSYGDASLNAAYLILGNILQSHPESSDEIFEIFKFCSELKKNDEDSLHTMYETLEKMLQNKSISSDRVFETFIRFLQSENSEKAYTDGFTALSKVLSAKPEMADRVFKIYKTMLLESESYNVDLHKGAFEGLRNIIKNQPEYINDVLSIIKETSAKFDTKVIDNITTNWYIYKPLNDIITNRPEYQDKALGLYSGSYSSYSVLKNVETDILLADKIIEKLTTDLQSEKKINTASLYEVLEKIAISYPELFDKIKKTFQMGLRSNKNELYSFSVVYESLHNINRKYPELTDKVLEILEVELITNKDNRYIKEAYNLLEDIIKHQPQYADKIFELFKIRVQSNSAEEYSYKFLKNIITSQPQYANKAFDLFELAVKNPPSEKNDSIFMGLTYCHDFQIYTALKEVFETKPEFANRIIDIYTTLIQSDKSIHSSTIEYIIREMGNIIKTNPDLSDKALDVILLGLEKTTEYTEHNDIYKTAYEISTNIYKLNPKPSEKNMEIYNKILLHSKVNNNLLIEIFKNLQDIISLNPQLAGQVFETFKLGLQSEKNGKYSLSVAYKTLGEIAKAQPQLAEQVFETFKFGLQSEENYVDSLEVAYKTLGDIVEAQPQLAEQMFETFKFGLQSEKNDAGSLKIAYEALGDIVKAQPQLAEQVLEMVKFGLQSKKNGRYSLSVAYETLGEIAKAQPQLAKQVFEIVKFGLQSEENDKYSLISAYYALGNIAKAQPQLAEQVLETIKLGLQQSEKNDKYSERRALLSIKSCMKNLPLEETIAKNPEMEQNLRVAHKGRFASDDEFKYALEHFDKAKLAAPESKIFHYQQADFSMLLEREAALNGISGTEICRYRHADASERVKDFYQEQKGWIVTASFKTSQLFARKAQTKTNPNAIALSSYLEKAQKCGISPHDAVDLLPEPVNPDVNTRMVGFLHRNLERVLQNRDNLDDLKMIINHWDSVEKKLQSTEEGAKLCRVNKQGQLTDNLDYAKVLSFCRSIKYNNQRNADFAAEAANKKNHLSASEYHKAEDIYLAGLKVPEPFDSKKEFKCGDYTARFLPREDPRVVFFGNYTDCCQHYGGIGHTCAISTVMHPFSQLFAVENKQGEIIAGSWVWENTEGKYRDVCFDNIEIKGDYSKETLEDMKESLNNSVADMIDCLDKVDAPELINLWKEYFQILRDCNIQAQQSAETSLKLEQLKKVGQVIDNKLQAKEIKSLPMFEQIAETWTSHKEIQQHYTSRKKVSDAIKSLYEQVGEYLTEPEQNCYRVTIGKGRQDLDISDYKETKALPLPKSYGLDYTDAHSQVLLCENPNAEPLDKTQESQRYIRDVCHLDIPDMEKVCAAVFTGADKHLTKPEREEDLAGFVIEDREKGVVGYCLYQQLNDDEYYIPDTAVLPEYRTDKNASSKKLFAEMMRCVREKGGTWYAEMREETSLRYLKAMAARGLTKYDILNDNEAESLGLNPTRQMEYDPKIKAASKVYPVRFEAVRDDVRQATARAKAKLKPQDDGKSAQTISLRPNNQSTPPHFTSRNSDENTA